MHSYIWITTVLFLLGSVAALFSLNLLKLLLYVCYAIAGCSLISNNFANPHAYLVWSFVFWVVAIIIDAFNNNSIDLVSTILAIWSFILLFSL